MIPRAIFSFSLYFTVWCAFSVRFLLRSEIFPSVLSGNQSFSLRTYYLPQISPLLVLILDISYYQLFLPSLINMSLTHLGKTWVAKTYANDRGVYIIRVKVILCTLPYIKGDLIRTCSSVDIVWVNVYIVRVIDYMRELAELWMSQIETLEDQCEWVSLSEWGQSGISWGSKECNYVFQGDRVRWLHSASNYPLWTPSHNSYFV